MASTVDCSEERPRIGDVFSNPATSGLVKGRHEREVDCKECGGPFAGLPEDVFCPPCATKHESLLEVRVLAEAVKGSEAEKRVRTAVASECRRNALTRKAQLPHEIRDANAAAFRLFVRAARARGVSAKHIAHVVHSEVLDPFSGWFGRRPRLGDHTLPLSWLAEPEDKPCPVCKVGKRGFFQELCLSCNRMHTALLLVRSTAVDAFAVLTGGKANKPSPHRERPSKRALDVFLGPFMREPIGSRPLTNANLAIQNLDLLRLRLAIAETRALGVPTQRIGEVVESAYSAVAKHTRDSRR